MNDQIDDEKGVTMEELQSNQALSCPRCDSSNTKFCYYNNYSLSQPRHFCKSCKRYWTRGGTLRNVPVGGGCRKNKRAKRPPPATSSSASIDAPPPRPSSSTTSSNPSSVQPNPLFYGILPTNHPSELSLPYPPTINSRGSNINHSADLSGFDLQPHLNGLGLGFSCEVPDNNFGFVNPNKQIQDFLTSNSLLSGYSMIGSSSTSASPTIASLLAPRAPHEQPKFISSSFKEVKMEESQNRLSWNNFPLQNQMDQISPSDSSMYWNTTSTGGGWLDPTNVGSSVPSLI